MTTPIKRAPVRERKPPRVKLTEDEAAQVSEKARKQVWRRSVL
jgi:hypothetical protein